MEYDVNDIKHMKRALELASKGAGFVNPNPLVGAVIVKDDKVIGEGFHERFGGPHAEINALNSCVESAEGGTVFVTLEPCSHFGTTPPCADALIKSGIKKVVCAMPDPNSLVAGKGLTRLKEAGITVVSGVLAGEAEKLNEVFIKYITTRQPFVILKSAVTLDGKIASPAGDSKWISNDKSREYVHMLRHKMAAVMVGINTVLCDNPLLSARIPGGRDPVKVIIDSRLRISPDAKLFESAAETIIVTAENADKDKINIIKKNATVLLMPLENGFIPLKSVADELGRRNIDSILIEGGGTLNSRALEEKIVDKLVIFMAPKLIGGKDALTFFEGPGIDKMRDAIKLRHDNVFKSEGDIVIESYVVRE